MTYPKFSIAGRGELVAGGVAHRAIVSGEGDGEYARVGGGQAKVPRGEPSQNPM